MSNDKPTRRNPDEGSDAAHRARNRTVMLTPDVTGQVRARLQQEGGLPTGTNPNDFITPAASTQIRATLPEPENTTPSPQRPQPQQHAPARRNDSLQPLIGFLVSFDKGTAGEYFELRSGRHIITSEDNGSTNNILIQHETVSPMHAILRVSPTGTIQILDQLSEHGTSLRRFGATEVEQLSGDKANLEHGDSLTFGERTFHVCIIAKSEEE
jgi:hypothetical protein